MSIQELIERIAERPAMYFGETTLTRFKAFLDGWMFASDYPEDAVQILNGFQNIIAEKYRVKSSHSWASIIRFYSSNDVVALDNAITLLKEYFKSLEDEVG